MRQGQILRKSDGNFRDDKFLLKNLNNYEMLTIEKLDKLATNFLGNGSKGDIKFIIMILKNPRTLKLCHTKKSVGRRV